MKKIFILLVTINLCLFTNAQGQDLPEITPPSPEASSLAKFTEIPVSYYTGLPNISIPLYTIQQKNINIPIGLSYHARGIQVGEVAPRVGLGWALNYGGSISRQTRGIEDESGNYGYLNTTFYDGIFTDPNVKSSTYNTYTNNPQLDFTPDVFHFNANGVSGKFIFDQKTLEPVVQKYDDISIDYTIANGKIASFIILDKNGVKYYFGISKNGLRKARNEDEVINNFVFTQSPSGLATLSNDGNRYFNSWQLMDIETPNGDLIEFYYELESSIFHRRSYDKKSDDGVTVQSYFSKISSNQYQISEIRFNAGKVVFIPSTTEREDLTNSKTLSSIEVYNNDNLLIKKQILNYTYTTSPSSNNQLSYLLLADPKANKRLFLSSVQQSDASNNTLPASLFNYNTELLPNRFSNSQDVWGFYNGADNGQYLTFFNYGVSINRRVDTIKSQAGILEKITYPTGGSTSFKYEQNKAIPPQSMKDLVSNSINPTTRIEAGLSNLESALYYSGGVYRKDITIGTNILGNVNINVSFTDSSGCSSSSNMPDCKFEVSIYNANNANPLFMGDNWMSLTSGTYTLQVIPKNHIHDPYNMMHGFNIILDWAEQVASDGDIIFAGGKRIKRIENQTSSGNISSFKEYTYVEPDGVSSGHLFGLPNFLSINKTISNNSSIPVYNFYGSIPGSPLKIAQGNTVGYSAVTEYYGEESNNLGKTVYNFTTFEDSGKYYEFPYHLPRDNEWLRGANLKTEIYKNNGGSYSLIKKTENEYLYGDTNSANYFVADIPLSSPGTQNPRVKNRNTFVLPLIIFEDIYANFKTYYLNGGTVDLNKTISTNYYENGASLETTSEYFYDYDNHYQIDKSKMISSDGNEVTSINYYPADVSNENSLGYNDLTTQELNAILLLQKKTSNNPFNQHRLAIPVQVETEIKKGNTIMSSSVQRTNFKDWGASLVLPEFVQTLKGNYNQTTNPLETRIQYYSYDSYGNPLEVSKTDGTHIVYIWGYDNQFPIAKIENTTYATIEGLAVFGSGFSITDGLSNAQETALRGLANTMVTTYTYDRLIGVTSITDPKGYTMTYTYDAFNRLEFVKDADGNILSKSEYNYKSQN